MKTSYEPKWITSKDKYETSMQLSECENYRWMYISKTDYDGPEDKKMIFKMINSACGTVDNNDATMRFCRSIATFNKCKSYAIVNFWPKRTADVKDLEKWFNETNLQEIFDVMAANMVNINIAVKRLEAYPESTIFVLACGRYNKHPELKKRVEYFMKECADLPIKCLGYNKDGSPKHPLFLSADTQLIKFDFKKSVIQ